MGRPSMGSRDGTVGGEQSGPMSRAAVGRWLPGLMIALTMTVGGLLVGPAQASTPSAAIALHDAYYVALGDSYSSGNGLVPALPGSGLCARSHAAYPEIVARTLGFTHLTFLACSGATIAVVRAQALRVRSDLRRARLVTLSAGGNDLPFSGLSEACIGLVDSVTAPSIRYLPNVSGAAPCGAAITRAATLLGATLDPTTNLVVPSAASVTLPLTGPSIIERRLDSLYRTVLGAMGALTAPMRDGPLVVVQYPTLLHLVAGGNCLLTPTPLPVPVPSSPTPAYLGFTSATASDLVQINRLLQRETSLVVANLRRQRMSRITVVAAPSSFHPLDCSRGTSADLNGIVLGSSIQGVASASLHPTSAGQSVLADGVMSRWRALVRQGLVAVSR